MDLRKKRTLEDLVSLQFCYNGRVIRCKSACNVISNRVFFVVHCYSGYVGHSGALASLLAELRSPTADVQVQDQKNANESLDPIRSTKCNRVNETLVGVWVITKQLFWSNSVSQKGWVEAQNHHKSSLSAEGPFCDWQGKTGF